MRKLTKRYVVQSLDGINLSKPIRYERYYINDNLRIQKKGNIFEKEVLNNENDIVNKEKISEDEFINLKTDAYSEIVRDSYLYIDDTRISIKKYFGKYDGLNRVEVKFSSLEEMNSYHKESWMKEEITESSLAFDKYLSKLSREEFEIELRKYI